MCFLKYAFSPRQSLSFLPFFHRMTAYLPKTNLLASSSTIGSPECPKKTSNPPRADLHQTSQACFLGLALSCA